MPFATAADPKRSDAAVESESIRLLEVDPDLFGFLTPEEECAAARLTLPVLTVTHADIEISTQVEHAKAFAALVLDGMLVHRVRIGDHPALRLFGPADVLCFGGEPSPIIVAESRCSSLSQTRLALLGGNLLIAARRFPQIVQGLSARIAEQSQRDAAHLAASQLPRVEQRLIAIMWLLAEKWGYVSAAGTVLPLAFTHETLGALIGARRPTVTLALRQLAERGQLLKHHHGWLIIEPPPGSCNQAPLPTNGSRTCASECQ
jgi:hypothetical protein